MISARVRRAALLCAMLLSPCSGAYHRRCSRGPPCTEVNLCQTIMPPQESTVGHGMRFVCGCLYLCAVEVQKCSTTRCETHCGSSLAIVEFWQILRGNRRLRRGQAYDLALAPTRDERGLPRNCHRAAHAESGSTSFTVAALKRSPSIKEFSIRNSLPIWLMPN
jgi:hypothetical protein